MAPEFLPVPGGPSPPRAAFAARLALPGPNARRRLLQAAPAPRLRPTVGARKNPQTTLDGGRVPRPASVRGGDGTASAELARHHSGHKRRRLGVRASRDGADPDVLCGLGGVAPRVCLGVLVGCLLRVQPGSTRARRRTSRPCLSSHTHSAGSQPPRCRPSASFKERHARTPVGCVRRSW